MWPPADCRFRHHIKPMCAVDLECLNGNCPNYKKHAFSETPAPITEPQPEIREIEQPVPIQAQPMFTFVTNHTIPLDSPIFNDPAVKQFLESMKSHSPGRMTTLDEHEIFKNLYPADLPPKPKRTRKKK